MSRVLTTNDVININTNSVKSGYNRTFSDEGVYALDPDGIHITGFTMIHNDDHMRVEMYLKVRNNDEPVVAFLDMSFEDYITTMTVEEACETLNISFPA